MDRRLFEAALTGNVQNLHQLLVEDPLVLHTVALASAGNPLHIASACGHINFVREIIRQKPDFAKEVNQEGFSPMHIASANGNVEIVRELLKVDRNLCRLQGPDKKTPLHSAAIKGRVDVVSEMLAACPDCIEDVTVQRQTALHLAVKNNQFEAIRVLMNWIKEMKKEDIFNVKDEQGNTVLHLATWKKQRQVIELLVGQRSNVSGLLEVNDTNLSGLTALDVLLIFPSEAGDREIEEILRTAGAMKGRNINHLSPTASPEPCDQTLLNNPVRPETRLSRPNDLVEYFKFKKGRDAPGETRTALLVVAVLVATATFRVGVNPPGNIWQDNSVPDQNNSTSINSQHYAGTSIMASMNVYAFSIFMLFNSIGFTLSLHIINILTSKFPLRLELRICIVALFFTYNTVVINIAPPGTPTIVCSVLGIFPIIIPLTIKLIRLHVERITKRMVGTIRRVI